MPSTASPVATTSARRARPNRWIVLILAAVVIIAIVTAIILTRALTPATGIQAALDSTDFTGCLEREGEPDDQPTAEGAGPWSVAEEREYWNHPLALHCASTGLVEDRRQRALSVAFPPQDDDRRISDDHITLEEQWQSVADYATWLEDQGIEHDVAMLRLTGLLRGLWVAEAEQPNGARGFAAVAVLADLRARGELPGYEDWLIETDQDDTARLLVFYSDNQLNEDRPENEEPFRDYMDRFDAVLETVR